MIHNKRQEGILIANLIEKSKEIDLKNIIIFTNLIKLKNWFIEKFW